MNISAPDTQTQRQFHSDEMTKYTIRKDIPRSGALRHSEDRRRRKEERKELQFRQPASQPTGLSPRSGRRDSPGCRKALASEFARRLLLHCTSRRRRARPAACSRVAADAGRSGGPFDRATAELKWPRFADARTASQGRRDERERESKAGFGRFTLFEVGRWCMGW